jgi:ABC-type transport system involved in multi-copper enzyme maturation permease subunit
MKFLAILRDSLREALDAKVIYFLFGLSGLVILLAGSLSFEPASPTEGLQLIVNRFPGASGPFGTPSPYSVKLENVELVNESLRGWEGEYRADLVVVDGTDAMGLGDKGEKPDKPAPPLGKGVVFRFFVLMDILTRTPAAELTDEQRELKPLLGVLRREAFRTGGKLDSPQGIKAVSALVGAANALPAARLEGWIESQFSGIGSLEASSVKLVNEADGAYRFRVVCKASPEAVRTWPQAVYLFFGGWKLASSVSIGGVMLLIENYLVGGFGAGIAMLLSTIITAFFIPNMLRKGTVDLLIAKPISRPALLVCKFIGGLTFMFLNTVLIVVGLWLVLGARSGLWGTGFLLNILVLTFQFAIFYAFSTLLGVLTRSPIICILGSCLLLVLLFGVGTLSAVLKPAPDSTEPPGWVWTTSNALRLGLPRYKDLDQLGGQLIARDLMPRNNVERTQVEQEASQVRWSEAVAVTAGYIALLLGLACWRFSVKDY